MIANTDYVELLATYRPAKPHNRRELAEMTALLETLAANEKPQTPAMERFIETLTALILQYEEEIQPALNTSPSGVLKTSEDCDLPTIRDKQANVEKIKFLFMS